MKLAHRIFFYLGGFVIGLVFLFFFLGGKRASCDYGPNARVLKNIGQKDLFFTNHALKVLEQEALDTASFSRALVDGRVLFSESKPRLDSCKLYVIKHHETEKTVKYTVTNCEKKATVTKVEVFQKN